MTRTKWKALSPVAQQVTIAQLLGWTEIYPAGDGEHLKGIPPDGSKDGVYYVPDYLNDLNAMHEAEKFLQDGSGRDSALDGEYSTNLGEISTGVDWVDSKYRSATATQRAEAFVLTMEEEE